MEVRRSGLWAPGKSDLIHIDCIGQSVEIDDTLAAFIDLT